MNISLQRMKSLLAWLDLKQGEWRPGDPPVFSSDSDINVDLRNEQSQFAGIATQLLDAFNDPANQGLAAGECAQWRDQVLRLIAEMQRLPIPKGIY